MKKLGGDERPLTSEEVLDEAAMVKKEAVILLASCVLDWTGIIWEGEPMACTQENAETLLTAQPFVQTQVDNFVGEASNFFVDA